MTYPQNGYPQQGYPQQQPPAQFYPPQQPPQGYYPQQPQGYGPPQYQQPASPPPAQLAKGSVTGFFNQPNGAFGKALKFDVQGRWYLMRVARDVNDGDSRQATDPKTKQPLWNSDGSAKLQLTIPVVVQPGLTPDHATGAATFYVQSKGQREELARAMSEAGVSEFKHGDVIFAMYVSDRSSGMGQPAKVYQMTYTPAANVDAVWGAQAPPMAPIEAQQQAPQLPPPPPAPPAGYAPNEYGPPAYGPPAQPQITHGPGAGYVGQATYPPPAAPQAPPPAPQQAPSQYQAPAQPQAQQGPPPAPPGVPQPPQAAPGAPGGPPQMTPDMQARMAQLAGMAAKQEQPTAQSPTS